MATAWNKRMLGWQPAVASHIDREIFFCDAGVLYSKDEAESATEHRRTPYQSNIVPEEIGVTPSC